MSRSAQRKLPVCGCLASASSNDRQGKSCADCRGGVQLPHVRKCGKNQERTPFMTEPGFWFLLGSASISAAVIGWVCFLEVSYRLGRRWRRAFSIGRAGLEKATDAVVLPPPTAGVRSREQLRLQVRTAVAKRKLSIRLHMRSLSKHVERPSVPNSTAVFS